MVSRMAGASVLDILPIPDTANPSLPKMRLTTAVASGGSTLHLLKLLLKLFNPTPSQPDVSKIGRLQQRTQHVLPPNPCSSDPSPQ